MNHRPVVLIVRDGWGANPHPEWNHANAVYLANTPIDERLMADFPHVQICTHGHDVGLPEGIMGNSEVGHQNIGAGRIVNQDIMRITRAIRDGSFFDLPMLKKVFSSAAEHDGNVHLLGLCSDAGVHSSLEHLYALLEYAKRARFDPTRVFLHVISDGRDSPPQSGLQFLREILRHMNNIGVGRMATVVGRYYAMDRDNRWDRTQATYRMLTDGEGAMVPGAEEAFQRYYDHPTDDSRHGDEFITPTVVADADGRPTATVGDGDGVVFFNYRGDRPRQLVKAFCYDEFPFRDPENRANRIGFERGRRLNLSFATMTSYESGLPVDVIMPPPDKMANILGAVLGDLGLRQFRCAETEKYPHVTFFFNDYREEPFPGEDRKIIPSPRDVPTYDLKPEMSAMAVADEVVRRVESGRYDAIIVNFANGDMVGHTGNLKAAVKAVETVDACVGRIVDAVGARDGALIITSDHGNCEQMIDPETNGPHTAHTVYDVELIVIGDSFRGRSLRAGGRLADIAPTILDMMHRTQPDEMTGHSLLV